MSTGVTNISAAAAGNPASNGDGSGGAGGGVLASDAAACASRSFEIQQLAARMAACADNTDAVLARLASVELRTWQSPAGRAYRTALSLQAASLRRSRTALEESVAVVLRHARNAAQASGRPG
ncbi:hypothetical protein NicSoilB4_35350 [Arthrobacter sp. NicSoilB4]|uniref:hypothetical protein n=1 Tax=Arthrobacter sp. NicSoilB4 TaxID=2830997 RepID=UPI001CC5BD90|nr:hypothetical protein [Arthrobacter sp. NicSoilB4]BCW68772.1 hypothetical protein NicSoilB4_35350 [Arthrobacter sp. NicSoilB4]